MPSAFVMRHPTTGSVEVWWSPCPSRECPVNEEINIVVDSCVDYCLLVEPNPKIEVIPQSPTKSPIFRNGDLDDLNFKVSKLKQTNQTRDKNLFPPDASTEPSLTLFESFTKVPFGNRSIFVNQTVFEGSEEESWVVDSGETAFFQLDMHPGLGNCSRSFKSIFIKFQLSKAMQSNNSVLRLKRIKTKT